MSLSKTTFGLQEFLDLPESGNASGGSLGDHRSELVDGEIILRVSPKYKHSIGQLRLLLALNQ